MLHRQPPIDAVALGNWAPDQRLRSDLSYRKAIFPGAAILLRKVGVCDVTKLNNRIPETAQIAPDPLAAPAALLAIWRGILFDLPLTWGMELSRFSQHILHAQMSYCTNLASCTDLDGVMEAQRRFARTMGRELEGEVLALTREAELAVPN
jgi:hypothetical protein